MPDPIYSAAALLKPGNLARLGVIGAVVALGAAGFAWAGGWFAGPARLTQTHLIDTFEAGNGPHPGFRRNHAKGVCLVGRFESNGAGQRLSRAAVFRPGPVAVFGRVSLAGGMPRQPDAPGTVRSLALNFTQPDGQQWRTGMIDIPVFPVRTPKAFYEQMVATGPDPKTGKPDPAAVKAFLAAHPETVAAVGIIKATPMSSGFADATYNALNAFLFVDGAGHATPVKWSMVPVDAFTPAPKDADTKDRNYLFDALETRLTRGPVRWHLVVTVGQPGDPTADPTRPWPATRQKLDVGTLTVTGLETEADGNCRDINFDPTVLPDGIAVSDDPLLPARSAAYSVSFTRRAGEPKSPSAVQVGSGS